MEIYEALEGKIYVNKKREELFAKVVYIKEDDEYTIDDFELKDEEKYLKIIKEFINKIPEEEK
jgi:hypothetical protein